MFKRSPSLTEQTKAYIKERILNNEFNGGRIPPETELASDMGVSRTTIREALSRLETEGTILRKQGAGTFVNQPGLQIKSRLEEIWSYERVLEAHGYTPTVRVLRVAEEKAGPQLAAELNIAANDSVLVIEKLFLEDDRPVVLACNRIPKQTIVNPYDEAACRLPLYDFVELCCQQDFSYYLSEIIPVLADDTVAGILQIPPHTALFTFEEVGYNAENEPILKASSYFRDDLLRFRLIRRRI